MEVGFGPGHTELDGDPAPPKRGAAPNFRPMSVVAKRLDESRYIWYGDRPRSRPHFVGGDPAPFSPERAIVPPHFSSHVCCDQTAGWIKVLFGTAVGLVPGYIVLDGDPAPPT